MKTLFLFLIITGCQVAIPIKQPNKVVQITEMQEGWFKVTTEGLVNGLSCIAWVDMLKNINEADSVKAARYREAVIFCDEFRKIRESWRRRNL